MHADNAQNSDALTNQCDGLKGVKGSIAGNQSEREGVIASNSLRSRHRMRQGDAVPRSQQRCAVQHPDLRTARPENCLQQIN